MHGLNSMVKQCYGQVYRWFFDWRLTETPSHSTEFHLLSAASLSAFPTLGQVHSTHTSMPISTFAFKHQLRNCPGLANPVVFLRLRHLPALAEGISRFHTLSYAFNQSESAMGLSFIVFLTRHTKKKTTKTPSFHRAFVKFSSLVSLDYRPPVFCLPHFIWLTWLPERRRKVFLHPVERLSSRLASKDSMVGSAVIQVLPWECLGKSFCKSRPSLLFFSLLVESRKAFLLWCEDVYVWVFERTQSCDVLHVCASFGDAQSHSREHCNIIQDSHDSHAQKSLSTGFHLCSRPVTHVFLSPAW